MFKPNLPPKLSITCSASPLRNNPWSTKIQVNWSPMAFVKARRQHLSQRHLINQVRLFIAYLFTDFSDFHIDEVFHAPVTSTATHIKSKMT